LSVIRGFSATWRYRFAPVKERVLFGIGYPVAIIVISRWIPVVRERRTAWFVAHELAVAAIVLGWVLRRRAQGVVVNGSWLVIAAAWYAIAGVRQRRPL
jgi:hypothetical protein